MEMNWRNILLIIAAVILLASASAYTVFTIIGEPLGGRGDGPSDSPRRAAPGPVFNVGTMVVNLSGRGVGGSPVARAGVAFEVDGEKTRRQLEQREEQVKDRIISIVRTQTLESVSTNEGLDELREQLKLAVNEVLTEGEVLDVYLFEWVVP